MLSALSVRLAQSRVGPLGTIFIFCLLVLLISTLSRIGLGLWQAERVAAVDGWPHLLIQGLRVDIATLCWLWGIAALGSVVFASNN
ncbi:MAG: LTA synthase family protein, partial [Shewanella sp.]